MLALGIHDGHTATAAVFENGKIVACISEERLNRQKEWAGFPELAISKCLEITKTQPEDFDAIGICSLMPQIGHKGYNKPLWLKRVCGCLVRVLPEGLLQKESNVRMVQAIGQRISQARRHFHTYALARLGFACPVHYYEHHQLHASTAYYTNWYRPDPCLVITLDGSGDGVCASVTIGEKGRLRRIASVFNYNSICEFYTRITQYLGMKPMSHEYKIMGMAPYADEKHRAELMDIFHTFYTVSDRNPLQFINTSRRWKWQLLALLADELAQKRFDNICSATQGLFEEVVLQWLKNVILQTGIHDLALSGGGFMNVKLNGRILNLPEVNSLFIFPSCGDEPNPIGAAIMAAISSGFECKSIEPLGAVYWGPMYTNEQIKLAIERSLVRNGFAVSYHDDIDRHVAGCLAEGKIVGRMTGRMEWGARALGNRSIVADARSQEVIHRINKAIKMRDFWMPFAPAVLSEYRQAYLCLKDGFRCPFMTMACDTKQRAHNDIPAALHPFDHSARPQVVDPVFHPSFYRMIKAFEEKTGVGGVLNTSFNIHGEPIVCSPDDAIHTFLDSDLDAVQMENFFVERIRKGV